MTNLIIPLIQSVLFFFSLRKGNRAAVSPAWSPTCFRESPAVSRGPSRMTPLSPRRDSRSAPCSPARREAVDGTRSSAKSPYRPRRDSFREKADSRGQTVQKEKSPCSLHPPPHSLFSAVPHGSWSSTPVPTAVPLPTHRLSSASKPSDQRLKELWEKSPPKKLEQLKKRIQEQKQKQRAASQEQKCLISTWAKEPLQKRPLKRKVCQVASAPPAPGYRGQ